MACLQTITRNQNNVCVLQKKNNNNIYIYTVFFNLSIYLSVYLSIYLRDGRKVEGGRKEKELSLFHGLTLHLVFTAKNCSAVHVEL